MESHELPEASALQPKASILLVDDVPANLLALRAILADLGHNIVEARSGEEALRRLLENEFAVILMDVQMPGLDGFETAKLIRGPKTSRHLPIIFLTAYESDLSTVERAYALGAVDYLIKPLVPVIVRAKVAGFIELFEKTQQIQWQADQLRHIERTTFGRKLAEENARLRESEARKAAILETALDCIITIDHQGRVIEFNPAAERVFGYTRCDIEGRQIADFIIPPHLREAHHRGLAHLLATGEGPVLNRRIEVPALRADGTEFPVELTIAQIALEGPPVFTAYLRDISERVRIERNRNLRLAVNQLLAEAATFPQAAQGVLKIVCEHLRWDLGCFWTLNLEAQRLQCFECWPSLTFAEFEATSRNRTFAPGEGLPGRVWATGQPAWIPDVIEDMNFPRAAIAVKAALHGAFGCPIVVAGKTLGVMEFFSRQIREPDAELLEMMATVAAQLGLLMERMSAEQQLRRREQELSDFFQNATIGMHWVGPDGIVLRANQTELDLFGYTQEEYVGRPLSQFHADKSVISDILQRLYAGETLHDYPARMLCKDGSIKEVLIDSSVLSEGEQFIHTRCFTRDVTAAKQAERALQESEQRFAGFMQHLPGLAWIKDLQGRYVYANDEAVKAFGMPRPELYGKTDEEVFTPETAARFKKNDRKAMNGTGVQVVESLEQGDGVVHHSLVCKFPIQGPLNGPLLVGGMAVDITDRVRAEESLKEANRRKDEFLATLAHELRNPLAPLRNSLEILKLPRVDSDTLDRCREVMERQVHQLVRLVDDLLDVSRVMRGKIDLRRERVELASIVARAVEMVQPLIEAQGHNLTIDLPHESLLLDADPVRLSQVVGNLLTNAAKYTQPAGRVAITAQRSGDQAVLRIRDNGIGIAPEMLHDIFDLFVQADHSTSRSQGGLGIGLTLVKNLVELHQGSVEVHSAGLGRGSEFVVTLPLMAETAGAPSRTAIAEPRSLPFSSGHRLMVVDDNRDAAKTLCLLFRLQGHEVEVAYDGPSALTLATDFRPAMIFLDIGMPGMDGYEVARHIRQQPDLSKTVLVALTGWGQQEDRRRTADAGFDHHLVKPLDPKELETLLAELQT